MMNENSTPTKEKRESILKQRKSRIENYSLHKITPSEFSNKTKRQFWKLHEGLLYLLHETTYGN